MHLCSTAVASPSSFTHNPLVPTWGHPCDLKRQKNYQLCYIITILLVTKPNLTLLSNPVNQFGLRFSPRPAPPFLPTTTDNPCPSLFTHPDLSLFSHLPISTSTPAIPQITPPPFLQLETPVLEQRW